MAAYMGSFWSSNTSKHLLRYALSRIDLLDTDALDLDKLDLNWGMKSVFTFQDVGINLKKIAKLLNLPPSFHLERAKVLQLRVTIPAAIYSNPITVEVDGVQVKLRVASTSDPDNDQGRRASRRNSRSENDDSDVVPHAIDLAQSFLDTQPSKEKAELEAAIEAETRDLAYSEASSSGDDSDDDPSTGTGQSLPLPVFLANFLQGIVDRMQVFIRGINFELAVHVPLEPGSDVPELVTLQLAIDDVNVEGVTASMTGSTPSAAPEIVHREGKRHIVLSKIRACLISEANISMAQPQSPSLPSSAATSSPAMSTRQPLSQDDTFMSTPSLGEHHMAASVDLEASTGLDQSQFYQSMMDSEEAFDIPYDMDDLGSNHIEDDERSAPSTPRAAASQSLPPSPLGDTPQLPADPAQSTIDRPSEPWVTPERGIRSQSALDQPAIPWEEASQYVPARSGSPPSQPPSQPTSTGSTPLPNEDLERSQMFSHADAESMYMSAFSEAAHSRMPGAWDSDSSDLESPPITRGHHRANDMPISADVSQETETNVDSGSPSVGNMISPGNEAAYPVDAVRKRQSVDNLHGATYSLENAEYTGDDIATPKGPPRMAKELISLFSVALYVPSTHHPTSPVDTEAEHQMHSLGASRARGMPGAFSVHEAARSTASIAEGPGPTYTSTSEAANNDFEIILSPLDVRCDLSTGMVLSSVVSKILSAFKSTSDKDQVPKTSDVGSNSSTHKDSSMKLVVERISLHFFETLAGVADTPSRHMSTEHTALANDALLTMSLQGLNLGIANMKASTVTSINLDKFTFGYRDDTIISFDQRLQMRASVMDAFPSKGNDVSVTITEKSGKPTTCEVKTLPLHIKLDLQRLDETFSWFGGLSSFLNMSSSMTSNMPPSPPKPATSSKPKQPRGVRFETPIRPEDKSASSENKSYIRLGGVHLELVGKDCDVSVDTSAVKLVTREEGIGVGISRIQLAGPILRNSMGDPPIRVEITNTRLEYLLSPMESDLDRLLALISPSKYKFDEADDEIMVETLLRQRRNGAVLRLNVEKFDLKMCHIQQLQVLPALGEEVGRLASVAKYLPEDDRPGILTLAMIHDTDVSVDIGGKLGSVQASLKSVEAGQIGVPSLVAVGVGSLSVQRNYTEILVESTTHTRQQNGLRPVLSMRMIGGEIEPVIKLRMNDLGFEYRVPTVMDILGLEDDATPQDFEASLAASVANLGDQAHTAITGRHATSEPSGGQKGKQKAASPTKVQVMIDDCLTGLNPLGLTSKMQVVLTEAHLTVSLSDGDDIKAMANIKKASVLLIDDVSLLGLNDAPPTRRRPTSSATPDSQIAKLCEQGYVQVCFLSSARGDVKIGISPKTGDKFVDVEVRDVFIVLETCADSTQTLIGLVNNLSPPTPPSKELKYRTQVEPLNNILDDISNEAFGQAEGEYDIDTDFAGLNIDELEDSQSTSEALEIDSDYFGAGPSSQENMFDAEDSMLHQSTSAVDTNDGVLLTFDSSADVIDDDEVNINDEHFGSGSVILGTAHRWNSAKNCYDVSTKSTVRNSPLAARVRDVNFIWNLFDGYDWNHTREVISKAVHDIENKATSTQTQRSHARTGSNPDVADEGDERVIEDFLFNSIYIGIPANRDPRELANAINHDLNENTTETESIATTAMTATPSRQGGVFKTKKKLKLHRSRHHKITFELKGINVDVIQFPPGTGETQSSIDVRIQDADIFDHVPTSTWRKFASFDQDSGPRPVGKGMVHLEILNVKPNEDLAATEIVLRATLLPLRLHVDQDALDFITRFFEFKDESSAPTHASPSDIPFIQRAEVMSVPLNLDFKPKRVDYAGLRSGHTSEFMNFMTLDQAHMVLRHTILYGVRGFDTLGKTLNDIWSPDVTRNQLPTVLAGLAPMRSIVNVGSGFRSLIEVPITEYKKDGRIVRSLGKGATEFAKTTGTELVKLGAKLAVGTQHALQGAEGLFVNQPDQHQQSGGWEDPDDAGSDDEKRQISLYANQPTGVVSGVKGAYSSLRRDLHMARDAIIAVPGEVMESQNAQGAAQAVLRRAPTIIFRPLIGSSKAIGQTLMGATNTIDPENRRRMSEKYKSH